MKVLIMAGGTGGHVFPGLAVAARLQELGHTVEWLGTQQGLDTKLVPKAQITLHKIAITGLRGKGKLGLLAAPWKIIRALRQSLRVIKQVQPDVVLGMGGYVTGPGGLAAWLKRIPLVIHEQNAIAGKTNRILARFARCVLEAFPNSLPKKYQPIWVGNPIRQNIIDIAPPEQRYAQREGKLNVFIFGGSQGAKAINTTVITWLSTQADAMNIWHQTGAREEATVKQGYQEVGVTAKVVAFVDDMAAALSWADLVICRAGALSVSELTCAGLASVLIPFPYAVDDHQMVNAQFLAQAQAAIVIPQTQFTAEYLTDICSKLDREALLQMAMAARQLAKPEATESVMLKCLEVGKTDA